MNAPINLRGFLSSQKGILLLHGLYVLDTQTAGQVMYLTPQGRILESCNQNKFFKDRLAIREYIILDKLGIERHYRSKKTVGPDRQSSHGTKKKKCM
jgi:hypothetical protein